MSPVFNPQIQPTNDPNYLGYSRSVEAPAPNQATKMALETLGATGEGLIGLADTTVKKSLDDTVRKTVETHRDSYTSALQSVRNQQNAGLIPVAGSTDSLMDANASMDVPDGLSAGLDRAANIGAAAGQSNNRINDTLYTANLTAAAKQLRAQYPGYKDYIDERFSKISGMDPANAYYKNLMEDINRTAAKAGQEANKIDNLLLSAVKEGDVPDADKLRALWKAGKADENQVVSWIFKARASKAASTAAEAERVARKGGREETAATATRDFAKEINDGVQSSTELIQIGTGTQTIQGAVKFLDQMAQNPNTYDGKQVQQIVTALQSKRDEIAMRYKARANERASDGSTYTTRMGGSKAVDDEIKGALSGLDKYIESVNSGQFGIGTYAQRVVQSQTDAGAMSLLNNPKIGERIQKISGLQKLAPAYADVFVKSGLVVDMPKELNEYFQDTRIDAATQPNFLTKGEPATLAKAIKDARTKGVEGSSKLYNNLFDIAKVIADPKAPDELKKNVAIFAFHPDNIGVLNNLKMDYYDPNRKVTVPGKFSAFSRMTSSDITDNMWKLKNQGTDGQEAWGNYKNWTTTEFQKLFREDIANLNNINESRLHLGWNTGEKGNPPTLQLLDERGKLVEGVPITYSQGQAMRTVRRINSAMYDLHQIYKHEGQDTNIPILQNVLQTWQPNEKVTGFPEKLQQALLKSHADKTQKLEDTFFPEKK